MPLGSRRGGRWLVRRRGGAREAPHPLDGLGVLLEEAARRRLDALPLAAVVAQIAALEAGELLALTRHLRPRLVPGEEPPAVAERIVRMSAEELQGLARGLRERLAAEA